MLDQLLATLVAGRGGECRGQIRGHALSAQLGSMPIPSTASAISPTRKPEEVSRPDD